MAPPTDAADPSRIDFLAPAGLCLVVALAAYRGGIYPRVVATSWGLILRNPLIPRQVSWGEIAQVIPGKDGITFIRTEKWPATAWAVQQAPISRLFRRITRAEVVVSQILDLAHEHGSPLDEDENLSYRAGPPR